MQEPWFDPNTFGAWYGTLVGGVGGGLGGLLGAAIGAWAPQGRHRGFVFTAMWAFIALGVLQLAFGVAALLSGQPYGIWYGPLLAGSLFTIIFSALMPGVRRAYHGAESRRLDAEGFRRGS